MNAQNLEVPDMAKAKKLWIHCNCCYEYYVIRKNILFLLACQHVICEKCITASLGLTPCDAPTYICPICQKKVRGRQVNNALPSNLKDMFHPEPWQDGLQHNYIDTFQKTNQKNFEKHIDRKDVEMLKVDKDIELAYTVCRKHYLQQQELRTKRKQMELRAKEIKNQAKIKREQAQRRHKSVSPKSQLNKLAEQDIKSYRSKSFSLNKKLESRNEAITSFVHQNNNSFIL